MINRQLKERILALSAKYPIVTLTGPRQSGKRACGNAASYTDGVIISRQSPLAERTM